MMIRKEPKTKNRKDSRGLLQTSTASLYILILFPFGVLFGLECLAPIAHRRFARLSRHLLKKQVLTFLDGKICHGLLKPDVIPTY